MSVTSTDPTRPAFNPDSVAGFYSRNKELLALVLGVVSVMFAAWLSNRDLMQRAAATAQVVLPDIERPGSSLVERVTHIESTRWTPEHEARVDRERRDREDRDRTTILAKLKSMEDTSRTCSAQIAEVREWVREIVGESRRKDK